MCACISTTHTLVRLLLLPRRRRRRRRRCPAHSTNSFTIRVTAGEALPLAGLEPTLSGKKHCSSSSSRTGANANSGSHILKVPHICAVVEFGGVGSRSSDSGATLRRRFIQSTDEPFSPLPFLPGHSFIHSGVHSFYSHTTYAKTRSSKSD